MLDQLPSARAARLHRRAVCPPAMAGWGGGASPRGAGRAVLPPVANGVRSGPDRHVPLPTRCTATVGWPGAPRRRGTAGAADSDGGGPVYPCCCRRPSTRTTRRRWCSSASCPPGTARFGDGGARAGWLAADDPARRLLSKDWLLVSA